MEVDISITIMQNANYLYLSNYLSTMFIPVNRVKLMFSFKIKYLLTDARLSKPQAAK